MAKLACPNCAAPIGEHVTDYGDCACAACGLAGPRDVLEALAKRLADLEQLARDRGDEVRGRGEDLRKLHARADLRRKQLRQARLNIAELRDFYEGAESTLKNVIEEAHESRERAAELEQQLAQALEALLKERDDG